MERNFANDPDEIPYLYVDVGIDQNVYDGQNAVSLDWIQSEQNFKL